jgi:hypothetical protein
MDEQEWLFGRRASAMLEYLGDGASERKLMLLEVACTRAFYLERLGEAGRRYLDWAEGWAETDADRKSFNETESWTPQVLRDYVAGQPPLIQWRISDWIGCAFGNPFQSPSLDPSWRTEPVREAAQAAYDQRELPGGTLAPDRLRALADALEGAGCHDESVLRHLREHPSHIRGCWVLDFILEKA